VVSRSLEVTPINSVNFPETLLNLLVVLWKGLFTVVPGQPLKYMVKLAERDYP
jgi:hypothetical protein